MEKDLAYYLTLYKLEGHETWRVVLGRDKDYFEQKEIKNWGPNVKITEKNVIRIDRLSGTIIPL